MTTENDMVGWHQPYGLGHKYEQTRGDSEGQEAWQAAIQGVTQSRTGLKRLRNSSSRFEQIKAARLYGATAGQGAEVKKVAS